MAGMLPGVELARRRRTHHHHESSSREPYPFRSSSRLEPTTALGEAALRARTRLEQKLRGGSDSRSDICSGATYQPTNLRRSANYPSTRWSKNQPSKGGGSKKAAVANAKETHETVVRRETGYREDVCAVCLDEFRVKQQVMNLPCSHRYHSDCLLPWLNVHSYCPCCRTHVQS